jgi:phosphoserine phosphatase
MKLLVFDVEGTIFKTKIRLPGTDIDSTIWQTIAYVLGSEAIKEEVNTHLMWENGVYKSYIDWMRDTILIHQKYGIKESLFTKIIESAEYNIGVKDFFANVDRQEYIPVIISGGFQNLSKRAQIELNINHSFGACEYFFNSKGELGSYNLLPCDFYGKVQFINILLNEYKLNDDDWIFIGDGKNDIEIAKNAPISVGFCPHNELRSIVNFVIEDFSELLSIIQ